MLERSLRRIPIPDPTVAAFVISSFSSSDGSGRFDGAAQMMLIRAG